MKPDTTYAGGATFLGTGLDFSSDPAVVKESIALLKQRNPNTKVLVAVGGATYWEFSKLNTKAIAAFVKEFGLDGVDLDYEPTNPGCTKNALSGKISCLTDTEYIASIQALRAALPRPYMLSTAPWSIGAYGEGAFVNAQPQGAYTGVAINPLRTAGADLDLLNVMSYDASNALNVTEAYDAYRALFPGAIAMGVEVPPEAWGGHVLTLPEVAQIADYLKAHGGNGMMLWSLQKPGSPSPAAISNVICNKFSLGACSTPL